MSPAAPDATANPIRCRHVVASGLLVTPDEHERGVGAPVAVLGRDFVGAWGGINGDRGFSGGEFERRLWEEGEFRLRMPNAAGEDGRLHRDRWAVTHEEIHDSRPGDEWVEVYEGEPGRLKFVGVPLDAELRPGQVELQGSDALWTLRKVREFEAGFFCNAPRDVFEHYTRVWKASVADDFGTFSFDWTNGSFGAASTTADGRFSYYRAGTTSLPGAVPDPPAGRIRLATNTNGSNATAALWANETIEIGTEAADPHAAWRIEFRAWRSTFASTTAFLVGLQEQNTETEVVRFRMEENQTLHFTNVMSGNDKDGFNTKRPGPFYITIEGRDRWVYFYLDGRLTAVAPMPIGPGGGGGYVCEPFIRLATASGDGAGADRWVDIDSMLVRTAQPYLMRDTDKGDYHLGPGVGDLAAGGLQASYYDDHDLDVMASANRPHHMLAPTKTPYHRKLEETINFTASAWHPVGPHNGNKWSVRFIGSVYLDLETSDIALALNSSVAKRRRLWVGKTRVDELLVDQWDTAASGRTSTGGLRAHLGTVTGWYPIVVEYASASGTSTFLLEIDVNVDGSWAVVTEDLLSPFGIVEGHVRGESHYDQLRATAETYGLQYTCEPRQLESGFFPGHVAPKVRVGRDTQKVIDRIEATDFGKTVSIREVADTIFADASGIADRDSAGQLTAEAIDYSTIESRWFVQQEYEQAPDIDFKPHLERRLDVLLALRRNAWEEVGAAPKGVRELLDRFPLTGDIALFDWEPGDGVRLQIPDVGIHDTEPRQILGIRRTFRPDGLLRPIVSFRPRPRGFSTLLRNLKLASTRHARNYQSQFVLVNGNIAAQNDVNIPVGTTRLPMPPVGAQIVKMTFVVMTIAGGTWDLNVGGTSPAVVGITEAGRYDVTPWAEQDSAGNQFITGSVTATAGGSNVIRFALEALYLVARSG